MIRDYLHYRRKGIGPLDSFKMAWARRLLSEYTVIILALLALVWLILFDVFSTLTERHNELVLSAHVSKLERNLEADKVERLEAVLIACLEHEPITINGRSMNCSIGEHKEAVDI